MFYVKVAFEKTILGLAHNVLMGTFYSGHAAIVLPIAGNVFLE